MHFAYFVRYSVRYILTTAKDGREMDKLCLSLSFRPSTPLVHTGAGGGQTDADRLSRHQGTLSLHGGGALAFLRAGPLPGPPGQSVQFRPWNSIPVTLYTLYMYIYIFG